MCPGLNRYSFIGIHRHSAPPCDGKPAFMIGINWHLSAFIGICRRWLTLQHDGNNTVASCACARATAPVKKKPV